MSLPAELNPPLGSVEEANRQIESAVRFICGFQKTESVSLIAHTAGAIAAGMFASRCPELVNRLIFFAPIGLRQSDKPPTRYSAWRLISLRISGNDSLKMSQRTIVQFSKRDTFKGKGTVPGD